jgi:hypothetical protein
MDTEIGYVFYFLFICGSGYLTMLLLSQTYVENPGSCHVEFVVETSDAGAGFVRVLRFPLQIFIPQILHNHHDLSSGAGTIGQ